MAQREVTRTLVKSQPEVWAQCSVAESLERHMSGCFGEIRITRLEPEHSVAWEGEQVRGTVRIEPSAWGTRVTMAIDVAGEQAPPEPAEPVEVPPPEALAAVEEVASDEAVEPVEAPVPAETQAAAGEPRRRAGRLSRWWARLRRAPAFAEEAGAAAPEAEEPLETTDASAESAPSEPSPPELAEATPPAAEATPGPRQEAPEDDETTAALNAALESLGQAHHRPYSRA